jgi:ribosomal protein L7/L12
MPIRFLASLLLSKVSETEMNEVELIQRFREVERKVNFLLSELGLEEKYRSYEPSVPEMEDVQQLVRMGQLIQAIKLYRDKTGAGLAEAKAAVESMKY